ncbi:hypothetical protein FHS95_001373 [Sphingomonas naasensis]|uniref:UrcA family protein n=1 Tax=Sphingomonas naasensis TaxID=1344951 RepID=A0A4S1WB99_9SPHN|nr:hypothetical protein [Sphingomonas naasensis]NIJ19704.1 hypothetical protein [Sphingomonas naasensis]TGX40148.1 hypothetical protein E5A74_16420 [Sphingomonas naasensis]
MKHVALALAAAGLLSASPAAALQRELDRAYALLQGGSYKSAQAAARAYMQANGPRFSAAMIIAIAQCMQRPHRSENAQPFLQIRRDYSVPAAKNREIDKLIRDCTSPRPRPVPQEAGVSTEALTVQLDTRAARPGAGEPPPTRPPVRIIRSPVSPTLDLSRGTTLVHPAAAGQCRQGFVSRGAFAGDRVCVSPATREQVRQDNGAARARIDPRGAYGPNTCIQGFVWRGARPSDLVCVTPAQRDQAVRDNRAAAGRRAQ